MVCVDSVKEDGIMDLWALDYTCVCILDGFRNEAAAKAMENLLKTVSAAKAAELIKVQSGNNMHINMLWLIVVLDKAAKVAIFSFCQCLLWFISSW